MEATAEAPLGEPDALPIGGWLILPAIGLVLALLVLLAKLVELFAIPPEEQSSLWWPVVFLYIAWIVYLATVTFGFFSRKRWVPKAYIGLHAINLGVCIAFIQFATPSDTAFSVVTAAVWIPYFLKSKRVKATFVR